MVPGDAEASDAGKLVDSRKRAGLLASPNRRTPSQRRPTLLSVVNDQPSARHACPHGRDRRARQIARAGSCEDHTHRATARRDTKRNGSRINGTGGGCEATPDRAHGNRRCTLLAHSTPRLSPSRMPDEGAAPTKESHTRKPPRSGDSSADGSNEERGSAERLLLPPVSLCVVSPLLFPFWSGGFLRDFPAWPLVAVPVSLWAEQSCLQ
jgi:hypothetical protein